jgi:M6 family metalloprotease-like protein
MLITLLALISLTAHAQTPLSMPPESIDPVYVDWTNTSGSEDGSSERPYNTVVEGIGAVSDEGVVWIRPGFYAESLTINRPMTVYATNGMVRIDSISTLTDVVSAPFQSLRTTHNVRQALLTILFDYQDANGPKPSKADVEAILFGETNGLQGYYQENSNGHFVFENAGLLGWYTSDYPHAFYARLPPFDPVSARGTEHHWVDENGVEYYLDDEGFLGGHSHRWAEAIRKAAQDFDFAAYDHNADGYLHPRELGILIIVPSGNQDGINRLVVGRQIPKVEPLIVDGVQAPIMAEVYTGRPLQYGTIAHELAHLFLDHEDMYFWFFQPFAAGTYSLMDAGNVPIPPTHLDAFSKLKLGWLQPQLILQSGQYFLPDVETHHSGFVLVNPQRSLDEYFLVENRWPGDSYDRGMMDSGLAVWHIIENPQVYSALPPPPGSPTEEWNKVQPGEWARRGIRMIRPVVGPPFDDHKALWDGSDPLTGYDLLSDSSDSQRAALRWADGTPSGFAIRRISCAGPTMSMMIEVPWSPGTFSASGAFEPSACPGQYHIYLPLIGSG